MGRPTSPSGIVGLDTEVEDFVLKHYGVKGMKWGVRRKRASTPGSEDSERATALKTRATSEGTKSLSNQELQTLVTRMNLEQQYSRLSPQTKTTGRKYAEAALRAAGPLAVTAFSAQLGPAAPIAAAVATALAKQK